MSDRTTRLPARRRLQARVEPMEARQLLTSMLGLTAAGELASFDSARPDLIRSLTPIDGLQGGETILGIESRPATGQIYGLGSTGRLYTIDPSSGNAGIVGAGPLAAALSGTEFDLDFNPVVDRLRIVSDSGLDLRVNPNTGEVTVDPNLAYDTGDAGSGTTPSVLGAAYTSNVPGAAATTLYEIDAQRDFLVTQGSVGGSPVSANAGQLFSVGALGVLADGPLGFEIAADGAAFVSQGTPGGGGDSLYSVNLATGAVTLAGAFPTSTTIRDITSQPRVETLYAVTTTNVLVSFRSSTPGVLLSSQPILGLGAGETIESIDARPATGQLFGFGSSGRLYLINPTTAFASAVSTTPISPAATGTRPTIDFNPTVDRVRFVTDAGQNLRINPDTGAVAATDGNLAYDGTDLAAGVSPTVVSEAYTGSFFGSTTTTLYGIDSSRDTLVRQGSDGASPVSPNSGTLFTVGGLGFDTDENVGLDVAANGLAFASLTEPGTSTSVLYAINLATGATTRIGAIGAGAVVRDVAVAPAGFVQFTTSDFAVAQTAGRATIVVTRIGGGSGPVSVSFSTSDGSARAGTDYTATSGTLEFADGETVKTFSIPVAANSFPSGSRTVNISLAAVSGGVVVGPVSTATLSINSPNPPEAAPALLGAAYRGTANAISSVVLTFSTSLDAARAATASNFALEVRTSGRNPVNLGVGIASATYDDATRTVRLTLSQPLNLRLYSSLLVRARAGSGASGLTNAGGVPLGTDAVFRSFVLAGRQVSYLDASGDRVFLNSGGFAPLVVLRSVDGEATQAFANGPGRRIITGRILRARNSDGRTTIGRFVVRNSRLKLGPRFQIGQVVTSGQEA